ncbi:hypothetical protein DPEC_G00339380, partial [Dallia pectoralis]
IPDTRDITRRHWLWSGRPVQNSAGIQASVPGDTELRVPGKGSHTVLPGKGPAAVARADTETTGEQESSQPEEQRPTFYPDHLLGLATSSVSLFVLSLTSFRKAQRLWLGAKRRGTKGI